MKKKIFSFVVELVAALLLSACGGQVEDTTAYNEELTTIEDVEQPLSSSDINAEKYIEDEIITEECIKEDYTKEDLLEEVKNLHESGDDFKVFELVHSYQNEDIDAHIYDCNFELYTIIEEVDYIKNNYAALTAYTGIDFPWCVNPDFVQVDFCQFTVGSIGFEYIETTEDGFYHYIGNEWRNSEPTGDTVEIYTLNPLSKPSGYSMDFTGVYLGSEVRINNGFASNSYIFIVDDNFQYANPENDIEYYKSAKSVASDIVEDMIHILSGEEPETIYTEESF